MGETHGESGDRDSGPLHTIPGFKLFSRWERAHKKKHLSPCLPDTYRSGWGTLALREVEPVCLGKDGLSVQGFSPVPQSCDHVAPLVGTGFEHCSFHMKTGSAALFESPFISLISGDLCNNPGLGLEGQLCLSLSHS